MLKFLIIGLFFLLLLFSGELVSLLFAFAGAYMLGDMASKKLEPFVGQSLGQSSQAQNLIAYA